MGEGREKREGGKEMEGRLGGKKELEREGRTEEEREGKGRGRKGKKKRIPGHGRVC